jgi:hypothetical protein
MPVEIALPVLVLLCFALAFLPPGPEEARVWREQEWWGEE